MNTQSNSPSLAHQIQDLSLMLGDVVAETRALATRQVEQKDVIVNVEPTPITVEASGPDVVVNVPTPSVNVTVPVPVINVAQAAAPEVNVSPQVNVLPSKPAAYVCRITKRDAEGLIEEFTLNPV